MGNFLKATREAAKNVDKFASRLEGLPSGGGGGGGGGGSSISAPTIFNTTVQVSPEGGDLQARAFSYFKISADGKSNAFIRQIVAEFLRATKKSEGSGLNYRAGGVG